MNVNSRSINIDDNEINLSIWMDSTESALELALDLCRLLRDIEKANEPVPIND